MTALPSTRFRLPKFFADRRLTRGWLKIGLACLLAGCLNTPGWAQVDNWQGQLPVVNLTTPYNWHLVVTEEFLNRFVAQDRLEPGRVDDFVFGAKVDGEQWSKTHLRLDLKPSPDKAAAAFILAGQVQTDTIGRTDQGAVRSIGHQEFLANKEIYFNGFEFSTRRAVVQARANNQAVAASTRLDGTFLERAAQKFAINRAQQQRPQTEAYARGKVVDNVFPAFDGSIDGQLANANHLLKTQAIPGLQQLKLMPVRQHVMTTDTHLHVAARTAVPIEDPEIPIPATPLAGPHAITLYLHESLPNSLIDRFDLRGKKTTDREIKSIFENLGKSMGGHLANVVPPRETTGNGFPGLPGGIETTIEFDDIDPFRIRFGTGQMLVEIRATFKPAGQNLLPPLLIRVPLQLRERTHDWELARGKIDIAPTNGQDLPDVAAGLIRQALESNMPPIEIPRELAIPGWPSTVPHLKLTEARAAFGWVAISFD